MASTHIHPRRRGVKATSPQMTPLDTLNLFSKAGTFHHPNSPPSDLCDPIVNTAFMPKRSSTSVENLEDLLLEGSGSRRMTHILEQFDRAFTDRPSISIHEGSILADPEVLPIPRFVLDNAVDENAMDIDVDVKVSPITHHHTSDSGLGSSVGGSRYEDRSARRSVASTTSSHSAITKSFSALGSKTGTDRSLSRNAIRTIEERIIKPILAEASLKDFHPLIADVPHRIGNKDISNLRDLEKTLIFLAPDYSASPESYRIFCERSIQCIHTTVEYLCERDQRLPTDRPYTNNYFLDLVEQIRRYASIMAATRRKQENGDELDEMDYSPEEKITLRGGLSHNGRPAELVREKDGKVLPLAEENKVDEAFVEHFNGIKRSLEEDSDMEGDDATRSMARRRKSDKAGDVSHRCNQCKKDFKRPCDLTKHEKTHSRPFKCPEAKCKYHTYGWPTEKECDRHVNDKHSAAPPQYKCMYENCAYVSKRESNCKQHMEKTHGYEYVRSKSNGRTKKSPASNTPPTPLIPTPRSVLASSSHTPATPFEPSPSVAALEEFNFDTYTPAMSAMGIQEYNTLRRDSNTTAGTYMTGSSSNFSPQQPINHFVNAISPEEHAVNNDVLFAPGFGDFDQQQPTPALSIGYDFNNLGNNLGFGMSMDTNMPHLSPGGQADLTLYSPQDNDDGIPFDEGFQDDIAAMSNMNVPMGGGDFQLFDHATGGVDLNAQWFEGTEFNNYSQFPMDDHVNF